MSKPDLDQLLTERGLRRSLLVTACGVNKSTVLYWARRGIPPERVAEVELITGIPRAKLRPDIFGESTQ